MTLNTSYRTKLLFSICALATGFAATAQAQLGGSNPNWPHKLVQKWKISRGDSGGSPVIAGDKLFVFAREPGFLDATYSINPENGEEIWFERYHAGGDAGEGAKPSTPPSIAKPAVAGDKIYMMGMAGVVSCVNTTSGKVAWRQGEHEEFSKFFTARSPLVVGNNCVTHFGGEDDGTITCFDATTGNKKWQWTCDSGSYASPAAMTIGDATYVIVQTDKSIAAINLVNGTTAWKQPCDMSGLLYNAVTPIVDGQTLIHAGYSRGGTAVKLEKEGDGLTAKELWNNPDLCPQFSNLLLKDGLVYTLNRRGNIVCINAKTGKNAWVEPLGGHGPYGSVVDGGPVLLAMTPESKLIVFQPGDKAFIELATVKVADKPVYGMPAVSGNRVFIQDQDSVALWVVE